ncbi:DNA-directed DNA polymerase II large subunit [Halohasta salina]|uniref:DNA-directed DNA polymerase II large subunit n=1 Tax=Halohasta salina TaxID=2961621 RepID=UPI0020A36D24|nr:DNA-directed DNA polymerase II large subunit [Halohasta salina]
MRPDDERYFDRIESRLDEAMAVAERAKGQGKDPQPEVEIPIAQDMADRVENILGIPNVAERVRELEGQMSREEAALELAKDFAEGRVGDYDSKAGKIEGAVRTAVALLTEGVVAAPIEGIDRVELLDNDDGTQFVNVYYAGPIRSAGGTAQALSVLVADYTRSILGLAEYKGREEEIERYVEEINLYDKDTGLQYSPKDKESRFIATNMPIMLDGEATGDLEVSGYRDLDRVDTNSSRGGMCLVMAEGIALKAPKIQRYTRQLDEVDWPWLQDLIDGTIEGDKDDSDEEATAEGDEDDADDEADDGDSETGDDSAPDGPARVKPKTKYLRDLIAGRPVFGHPSESGGFRLRYGRARNLGFATAGVHPATMHIIDDFLATGTQIKTERPGKAAGIIPVDSIEGPTVKLATGEVRRIDDPEEALELRNGVEKILDLGEYLVNYGEFVENNHPLAPAAYAPEWWIQEFDAAGADVQALEDDPHVDLESPTAAEALRWASEYDCPLHPKYTYVWHDIPVEAFEELAAAVADGETREGGDVLVVERSKTIRRSLETLLVAHQQTDESCEVRDWLPLARSLGVSEDLTKEWDELSDEAQAWDGGDNAVKAANEVAPFELRERAPTRIGARMGRPEKSESRDLSPAVHTLFPITEAGGSQRNVAEAARTMDDQGRRGVHSMRINQRLCPDCGTRTFKSQCPDCGAHTEPHYECEDCEVVCEPDEAGRVECPRCEREVTAADWEEVDLRSEYREALETIGEREGSFDILKGVKGLTSANKTPEPIEKGILRTKHGVSAFKDGTVRYDMTDLPVTAVKPEELDVTADHFRGLGYETDINGDPLRHDDQLVELNVQDIVLSDGAAEHMLKTADFVDDLLERLYGQPAFYDVEERDDLVGELVFGMAPHTSAAVVGRVVGFTSAAVGYAHPYFHAAKRRNCFHPETEIKYRNVGGEWQYEDIQSIVEERLTDPETDDFGTEFQKLSATIEVPSIDSDGNRTVQRVDAVSKHQSTNHLVTIETEHGREITVTPDHTMLRWDNGPQEVDAMALEVGDTVPAPSSPNREPVTGSDSSEPIELYGDGGNMLVDEITSVQYVESDIDHTYCLTVTETNTLVANDLFTAQCDGDEDCVMLLMDGLLNFSREFLPDKRGGRMDAPLVMSSRIDPAEIDDEAHNMDIVDTYPREFYEATLEMADPEEVDIQIGEDTLGTKDQYRGFDHTHSTTDIHMGPSLSAYKTLGSMMDKMDAQLELARKLRAVDETDVAERVIEYHFLPDLIGNLRAFSSQETRCLDCDEKYRRMPLSGECRECGGRVNLTVHEGSVNKYMDTAIEVAERFGCREYTKQRLRILERSLESVFENDKNKQSGIADFM